MNRRNFTKLISASPMTILTRKSSGEDIKRSDPTKDIYSLRFADGCIYKDNINLELSAYFDMTNAIKICELYLEFSEEHRRSDKINHPIYPCGKEHYTNYVYVYKNGKKISNREWRLQTIEYGHIFENGQLSMFEDPYFEMIYKYTCISHIENIEVELL